MNLVSTEYRLDYFHRKISIWWPKYESRSNWSSSLPIPYGYTARELVESNPEVDVYLSKDKSGRKNISEVLPDDK